MPAFFLSGWRDLLCQGMLHAYERCRTPSACSSAAVARGARSRPRGPVRLAARAAALAGRVAQACGAGGRAPERRRPGSRARPPGAARTKRPPAEATAKEYHPSDDGLATDPSEHAAEYHCAAAVGGDAGLWYPMSLQIGAFEQARDDALSLCYTSEPLAEDKTIAGSPTARVRLSVPEGESVHLTVKLCEVSPDGASTLITSGWRRIDAGPAREVTGEVELYPTAYRVRAGHAPLHDRRRRLPAHLAEPDGAGRRRALPSDDDPTTLSVPVVPAGEVSNT